VMCVSMVPTKCPGPISRVEYGTHETTEGNFWHA
jgi:hypothetical protein